MATGSKTTTGTSGQLQLVTFKIGNEEYGVEILHVQEINKVVDITEIPQSPAFVEGIINLRGKIVPVINLRKRLGMDEKADDQHTRVIVSEISGKTTGFKVDTVNEVLRIPSDKCEVPPELVSGKRSEFFRSIVRMDDKLIVLIDLGMLITAGEKESLQEAVV